MRLQANAGPWVRLAEETGATVKWWKAREAPACASSVDDLKDLLSSKTRIVALPHVSNILGEVMDMAAVVKAVRDGPAGILLTSRQHLHTLSHVLPAAHAAA